MPNSYTENYQLNQWVKSDQVLMEDFNADNAKIDEAIKEVDVRVDGLAQSKADVSALAELAASVDSLSGTVSGQGNTLAAKGNCQIVTTSYTGKGGYGSGSPCSLTFSAQPLLVIVLDQNGTPLIMVRPHTSAVREGYGLHASWSGNRVSWYHNTSDGNQLNRQGLTYYAVALLSLG